MKNGRMNVRLTAEEIKQLLELRARLGQAARRDGIAKTYTITETVMVAVATMLGNMTKAPTN